HYKWRAMRANGVNEYFITGEASDREKFLAWAATVPHTLRNPLYHWTHLELKTPFGITDVLLDSNSGDQIYDRCEELLQQDEFSTRGILNRMKVRVVCTTDDPLDTLQFHQQIADDPTFTIKVLPAYRPDRAMAVEDLHSFNQWLDGLGMTTGIDIANYTQLLEALADRHQFFHEMGCRLSDHGLEEPYSEPFTETEVTDIFLKARLFKSLNTAEIIKFKSAMLHELAVMDCEKGWTQQYHFGAIRNVNSRAFNQLGPDTGYDSIGDFNMASSLAHFFDSLEGKDKLAKTIIYNINPRDNEMIAAMIGNFQGGGIPGKMQFGSGWWFNDQKDGMERQINTLSNT
ncbi:MAG: glucuronate isomerase, partial [Desulfobulbaceae bacterium]